MKKMNLINMKGGKPKYPNWKVLLSIFHFYKNYLFNLLPDHVGEATTPPRCRSRSKSPNVSLFNGKPENGLRLPTFDPSQHQHYYFRPFYPYPMQSIPDNRQSLENEIYKRIPLVTPENKQQDEADQLRKLYDFYRIAHGKYF